ncbi:hypothetical protein [Okeania sp. SIO2B3]|nr:hypothetical protein [Okeania sp. SIO2B3]
MSQAKSIPEQLKPTLENGDRDSGTEFYRLSRPEFEELNLSIYL